MALLIDEVPAPLLQSRPSDLMIWLGPPPDPSLFTTPLAWDQLVIITNTSNPLSSISTENLTALFSGQITGWSDINGADKEVEIWIYPNGDEVRQIFETNIMVGSRFTSQAFLAPNPKAMLDAVAKDQGALGFIPDAWITPQVKILHVSPDLEEKLHQPVLAFTKDEPQALVRSFLLCLQGQTGQTTLSTKYQPLLQTSATP